MSDTIYSQHHFMFPFRWDILPAKFKLQSIKENIAFDERTDLNDTLFNNLANWTHKSFELQNEFGDIDHIKYNEFTYFHDFVQKAVFDFEYPWKKNQQIMKYYEYDLDKAKDNKYLISYLENSETKQLELRLEGITLHFFNTGVGVLTYNLSNIFESQKEKDSILKINEFGRRMYPQYLGDNGIVATQSNFLPISITLIANGKTLAIEDFSFYSLNNKELTVAEPYKLPTYIQHLFTDSVIFKMDKEQLFEKQILITKVTDDRMFFHSWYGNDVLANSFARNIIQKNDWWYCYIFGDKESPSIANNKMKAKQLKAHTYDRWLNYGTIYGMTRDSFVCLSDTGFGKKLTMQHMNTMYYTLSVLCLAQRTSVLKFTAEVANLADLAKIDPDKKLIDNIKGVYKNYIEFINKLYFREITPQIQGIEIYNQFQKILNLENEIKDLDSEISELHEYVSLIQTERQNSNDTRLNYIAMIFLPFTVVFGVLGANFFDDTTEWNILNSNTINKKVMFGLSIGISISFLLIGILFLSQYLIKKFKNKTMMYLCISTQPTWQNVILWAIIAGLIAYFLKLCFEFAKLEKEHKYSLDKKQQKELNQKEETEKSLIKQLNEKVKALEKNANDTKEIEKTKIELLKYAFEKSDDENDKKEYLEKLTALIKQ